MIIDIKLIDILNTIRNTLMYLNPNFKSHGDEVAYLVYKIGKELNYEKKYLEKLVLCAMFHDIGSCKTDDIKEVFDLKSDNTIKHCLYGYLFIKHFSPLSDIAPLVLYHHDEYYKFDEMLNRDAFSINIDDSNLIHFTDTISIYNKLFKNKTKFLLKVEELYSNLNNEFKDIYIREFKNLQHKENILDKIFYSNSDYKNELFNFLNEIEYTYEDIVEYIKLIVFSIDFKSSNTVTHSLAVNSATVTLCDLLKLDIQSKEELNLASFLHDIGKISTPSSILKYPGKLSEDDFEIIKKHVSVTRDILEHLNHDKIKNIASNHHERINGKGYPRKLSSNLTISDKILAVADVFAALTEKRYYRDSLPKDKTIEILTNCVKNNELDENIVLCAIDNYDLLVSNIENIVSGFNITFEKVRSDYYHQLEKYETLYKGNI